MKMRLEPHAAPKSRSADQPEKYEKRSARNHSRRNKDGIGGEDKRRPRLIVIPSRNINESDEKLSRCISTAIAKAEKHIAVNIRPASHRADREEAQAKHIIKAERKPMLSNVIGVATENKRNERYLTVRADVAKREAALEMKGNQIIKPMSQPKKEKSAKGHQKAEKPKSRKIKPQTQSLLALENRELHAPQLQRPSNDVPVNTMSSNISENISDIGARAASRRLPRRAIVMPYGEGIKVSYSFTNGSGRPTALLARAAIIRARPSATPASLRVPHRRQWRDNQYRPGGAAAVSRR